MKIRHFLFACVLIGNLVLPHAHSTENILSNIQIYRRCYSQLTNKILNTKDPFFLNVKNNKIDPIDACLSFLRSVYLDGDLQIKKSLSHQTHAEALAVFRRFHIFHTSWFPNLNLVNAGADSGASIIYDNTEMAYSIDRALFHQEANYSDILNEKHTYLATRTNGSTKFYIDIDQFQDRPQIEPGKEFVAGALENKDLLKWNVDLIEVGEIVGLKINSPKKSIIYPNGKDTSDYTITADPGKGLNAGGILGSASYILANTTTRENQKSNGTMTMHRNWSKNFFNDILCRELPVLREEDILNEVEANSDIAFRKDKLCMSCHSTMDPFAAVIRNVVLIPSNDLKDKFTSKLIGKVQTTEKSAPISPKKSDERYSQRPTEGVLKFRSFHGELIEKKVSSLDDLGKEITQTDDFYVCAAKKYFHFFTGIDVKINDFSQETEISPQKKKHRDFIVQLGLELKKDQKLFSLVERILRSDFYKMKNMEQDTL